MSVAPELKRLPLSQIKPDPTQSRTSFDPAKLDELKDSLKEHGLINPISVRQAGPLHPPEVWRDPLPEGEARALRSAHGRGSGEARGEGFYEIIAGERRYRAAALLGWPEIDCRVYPADTPVLETELLSLVENLQRVDLNPIEEARGFRQLNEPPYNLSHEVIARRVGKGRTYVTDALALLSLPEEVLQNVARATISPRHARVLAKITAIPRQIALAEQAAREGWSVRELEQQVRGGEGDRVRREDSAPPSHPPSSPQDGGVGEMLRVWHERRDAEKARLEAMDPLKGLWPTIRSETSRDGLDWRVTYKEDEWFFGLKRAQGSDPETTLGRWFRVMADWFERMNPTKKPDDALESVGPARIPKTKEEELELERLAAKGPEAVYAWIYGAGSLLVKSVKGTSWKDIDPSAAADPAASVRALIKQLKGQSNRARVIR